MTKNRFSEGIYEKDTIVAYYGGDRICFGSYQGMFNGRHILFPVVLQTVHEPVFVRECSKVILPKGALDESSGSSADRETSGEPEALA